MLYNLTIQNAKKYASTSRKEILPIIIIGKVLEIDKFEILNKKYTKFIFSDESGKVVIALIDKIKTNQKKKYIFAKYKNNDTLAIKEPRKAKQNLLSFGVEFEISSEDPPIGTDLIGFMEHSKNERLNVNEQNSNEIDKKNYNFSLKNRDVNSFVSASDLLIEEDHENNQLSLNTNFKSLDILINFLNENSNKITIVNYVEIFELKKISPLSFSTIVTYKNDIPMPFFSEVQCLGQNPNNGEWIKIFSFKIKEKESYYIIKQNLSFFNSLEEILKILKIGTLIT
jgi:hypothetical protein